jgi:hypothetical protein
VSAPGQQPWVPRSSCGPDSALTVAELRTRWAELGESSPILVVRSSNAQWAQHADVLVGDGGLLVARLFAPYAKQSQPAPGTVWPRPPYPSVMPPASPTAARPDKHPVRPAPSPTPRDTEGQAGPGPGPRDRRQ